MYEDRTQETITAEMLENFGANVRTDVGSLAYNACVKTGSELEDVYTDLQAQEDNALPDTMDLLHLIRFGEERGIFYKYATYAQVKAVFLQEIAIGTRFMCMDYVYSVTSQTEGNYTYIMTCEEDGTGPNTITGDLEPVDYIDGFLGGEITEVTVPGTDDEDIDVYRSRIISSYSAVAFGGNKADYRLYIDAQSGVGGCKPKRRAVGSEYIDIYLINSDYGIPSNDLVNTIQSLVDPEENHGEGDGMAPIGHNVKIKAVTGVTVNVSATLTLDTGYEIETIQTQAEEKIGNYLLSMRSEWESGEQNEQVVRLARIEAVLIGIEGVIDVTDLMINETAANLQVTWTAVPVLGTVTMED